MIEFPIHTKSSAPEAARPTLKEIEEQFGFVPNLLGELADAPTALNTYMKIDEQFESTSLGPVERDVVRLAASRANDCGYCSAVHSSTLANKDFPRDQIERLFAGETLSDDRLEALRRFTTAIVERRGNVTENEIDSFLDAGFERRQILEVMVGVTLKTLSNYVNHIMDTPVDEAFSEFAPEKMHAGVTA